MTKEEATAASARVWSLLREAGFADERALAALRTDEGRYLVLKDGGISGERDISDRGDPFAVAFSAKPDATAALLLPGQYALRASETVRSLPAELDDMAQIVGLTARTAMDASERELLRCLKGRNACLIRAQGMLTTGRSVTEAVTAAVLLEKAAMTRLLSAQLGGAKRVPLLSAALMHVVYQKKYAAINLAEEAGRGAATCAETAYSARERALREEIVAYGRKLVETGLVQGTWGNLSVRLDETHLLATPSGLDYRLLTPGDIVRVEMETLAYDGPRKPTSERRLHRDLYRAKSEAGAVIHTHARYCGVFAACNRPLPAVTEPMRRLAGGEVRCAPHALPSTKRLSRAALPALRERNACLLAHHGAVCCGRDLAEAFELCRAMEQAAALLLAGPEAAAAAAAEPNHADETAAD